MADRTDDVVLTAAGRTIKNIYFLHSGGQCHPNDNQVAGLIAATLGLTVAIIHPAPLKP